jgi:hypothetical protein
MNPFDQPPTGAPVPLDPPGPRRGRMAIAAIAAAGLVGGGIVVAGQFASADDRPTLDAAAVVDDPAPDESEMPGEGEIVVDDPDDQNTNGQNTGDPGPGDQVVIDIGGIIECLGPIFGEGSPFGLEGEGLPPLLFDDEFAQRMEEFIDGLPWDELGDLDLEDLGDLGDLGLDDGVRLFGSGGSIITVVGPDGIEVFDLGEGDATVTIEQTDGELTIETDGDVTVTEMPDLSELLDGLGELDLDGFDLDGFDLDGWEGLGDIESCFDD